MIWHKVSVRQENVISEDSVARYLIKYYEGDERGYHENNIYVEVGADGHISLYDYNSEGSIYLYPEQVDELLKIIKKHRTPKKKRGGK
jgi:hypothetical protein